MPTNEKIFQMVINERQDKNIKFRDLQKLLEALGFACRVRGDHHIYTHSEINEIVNIQPDKNMAKPYQVKQIRNYILRYNLKL